MYIGWNYFNSFLRFLMGFGLQSPPYFKEYWKLRVIGWLTFFMNIFNIQKNISQS